MGLNTSGSTTIFILTLLLLPFTSALRYLQSTSLNTCMQNSSFSATLFQVTFTPDNRTISAKIKGLSQVSGYVLLEFQVIGYGYSVYQSTINPCYEKDLEGMCPMPAQPEIDLPTNIPLDKSTVDQVPNAIYYIPDIDAKVKLWINSTDRTPLACVEAELSNGKTVHQKAVAWTIAVIAWLGFMASAVVSSLGHLNTAAHVASSALSLFSYFQAQALLGMTAITTPPIVKMWTQNFQWSMGIIRVGFLQRLATWYLRSTGGTSSTYLSGQTTTSVNLQRRSLGSFEALVKRVNNQLASAEQARMLTVKGIERVGFIARIEISNIFLTGYIFLVIVLLAVTIGFFLFKLIYGILVRRKGSSATSFIDSFVLKGILFRITLIAFPPIVVLGFWELTRRDSAAEVVLAIFTVLTMIFLLGWGAFKVWRIAHNSTKFHKTPTYALFSNPSILNKWGFLYIQFKASMCYFIIAILAEMLVKGMFVGLSQGSGIVQSVAILIIDAALLVAISVIRPYMDKKTNGFNISIASVNFLNAIFLLFFTNIFNLPPLAVAVLGIAFFVINAVFALVILLMVIWDSGWALFSKNPDIRYQPMRDDRGSFVKSHVSLATQELDALGRTARGEKLSYPQCYAHEPLDDGDDMSGPADAAAPPIPRQSRENPVRSTPLASHQYGDKGNPSPANLWQRGVGFQGGGLGSEYGKEYYGPGSTS